MTSRMSRKLVAQDPDGDRDGYERDREKDGDRRARDERPRCDRDQHDGGCREGPKDLAAHLVVALAVAKHECENADEDADHPAELADCPKRRERVV